MSKIHDECGVIGVCGSNAADRAVMGLHALQHRGQESAGAASFDGHLHTHKAMGLIDRVFGEPPSLPGNMAVAHNRYSTSGKSVGINAGPFTQETDLGPIALAHNGNIVNADALRQLVAESGLVPHSTSDSELLAMMLKVAPGDGWFQRIQFLATHAVGSYSLTILTADGVIGVRDPLGNRPLSLGTWTDSNGQGWALASESCAFPLMGATLIRDIAPGEVVQIREGGVINLGRLAASRQAFCAFEYIYIARPDSIIGGRSVHEVRRAMGAELADEHPANADVIIAVPDSGTSGALGYAERSGIPFGEGLIKNRYVGRTFIQPSHAERQRLIRMKFGVLPLTGKRVVLVDDSIVRGNTLTPICELLKEAGATEIHVRIASPRIHDPCYLGVDMASHEELIANHIHEDEMARRFDADSVAHISVEGLLRAIRGTKANTCLACFTGEYPIEIGSRRAAGQLEAVPA
jgi:amidophosphoribosyltransferase